MIDVSPNVKAIDDRFADIGDGYNENENETAIGRPICPWRFKEPSKEPELLCPFRYAYDLKDHKTNVQDTDESEKAKLNPKLDLTSSGYWRKQASLKDVQLTLSYLWCQQQTCSCMQTGHLAQFKRCDVPGRMVLHQDGRIKS